MSKESEERYGISIPAETIPKISSAGYKGSSISSLKLRGGNGVLFIFLN